MAATVSPRPPETASGGRTASDGGAAAYEAQTALVERYRDLQKELAAAERRVERLRRVDERDLTKNREMVRVLDWPVGVVWRAKMPVRELLGSLPAGARKVPNSQASQRILGMMLLGLATTALWFTALVAVFPNMVFVAVASLMLGSPPGVAWGWFIGPKLAKLLLGWTPWAPEEAFWLVRRIWNPWAGAWDIYPVLYDSTMGINPERDVRRSFVATAWASISQARGVRILFTREKGIGQVIQIASLATIAACAVGVVLFLVLATMD